MSTVDNETEHFVVLVDPDWEPAGDEEAPPFEAVIGVWPVAGTGAVGKFRTNPDYAPRHEDSPADPIDALLRLAMRGDATMEQVQLVLRDSLFDIAMNGDGRPLVVRSPDGLRCAVIATSMPNRERVGSPEWQRGDLDDLVGMLADETDVFVNPGGPAAVRLSGEFVRETMMMSDQDVAAVYADLNLGEGLTVVDWTPPQNG